MHNKQVHISPAPHSNANAKTNKETTQNLVIISFSMGNKLIERRWVVSNKENNEVGHLICFATRHHLKDARLALSQSLKI